MADGNRLLIQRFHYDHSDIPDAIGVFGVIDDQLSMHYYDARGIHRIFMLSFVNGILRYARNAPAPDLSQRVTLIVSGDGNTITGQVESSLDATNREHDLAIASSALDERRRDPQRPECDGMAGHRRQLLRDARHERPQLSIPTLAALLQGAPATTGSPRYAPSIRGTSSNTR